MPLAHTCDDGRRYAARVAFCASDYVSIFMAFLRRDGMGSFILVANLARMRRWISLSSFNGIQIGPCSGSRQCKENPALTTAQACRWLERIVESLGQDTRISF